MRVASPMPSSKEGVRSSRRSCRPRSSSKCRRMRRQHSVRGPRLGPEKSAFLSARSGGATNTTRSERVMADVTATMVMELRGRTGLGMMECKKALTETSGDLAKAEELLRIKSGAKASKAADRAATEGIIGATIAADRKSAAMVELNCETDFVARNEDFIAFARKLAQLVVQANPADVGALTAMALGGATVESARQALVQKLGGNIAIRRLGRINTPEHLAQYMH